MILKVVMDASDTNAKYVAQYTRLLPDSDPAEFQKILDMKGVRRSDQTPLVELYRSQLTDVHQQDDDRESAHASAANSSHGTLSPDHESSRIKKLEKLIKRRL